MMKISAMVVVTPRAPMCSPSEAHVGILPALRELRSRRFVDNAKYYALVAPAQGILLALSRRSARSPDVPAETLTAHASLVPANCIVPILQEQLSLQSLPHMAQEA